jgi:hypothetical protein
MFVARSLSEPAPSGIGRNAGRQFQHLCSGPARSSKPARASRSRRVPSPVLYTASGSSSLRHTYRLPFKDSPESKRYVESLAAGTLGLRLAVSLSTMAPLASALLRRPPF